MLNKKLLGSVSSLPQDDNFENVTLLLNGDGTNGGQNNTFLDSSTNNFTITRNGNTTQGSFSPYGTLWSVYSDGSGDYLSISDSASFPSGTTEFCYELWFYPTATTNGVLLAKGGDGGYYEQIGIQYNSSDLKCYIANSSNAYIVNAGNFGTPTVGQWNHIAVYRSGNNFYGSLNGTVTSLATSSNSVVDNAAAFVVSGYSSPNPVASPVTGYISNLRLVTGSAVYGASNFTPPTTPLTAISGTQLLMCQANRFIDSSSNAFSITVGGNPSVQRFSPFEPSAPYSTSVIGGSGYFDGSGDYLTAADNALIFGTNDFSIEWFEYRDALTAEGTPIRVGTGNTWETQLAYQGSTFPEFYVSTNGSSWNVFSGATAEKINAKEWNHFVFTRSGTAFRVFQNGKLVLYATGSGSLYQASTNTIRIMAALAFAGYITNVRVVNGSIPTTYQTSSTTTGTAIFTSPTAPLTTTSQGATSGDVKLLVNAVNASIADLAMQNNLETVGNAQVSTSVKKYGTGSLAFDGNGDVLSIPYRPMFNFSGDFTIECWLYVNSLASIGTVWSQNSGGTYFILHTNPSGGNNLGLYIDTLGASPAIASSSISTGVWYHVALTRSGSSFKLFLNGTQTGSTYTDSGNPTPSGTPSFFIGNNNASNGAPLNGYVDDLRITNGIARYTSNFTAPASALPTY